MIKKSFVWFCLITLSIISTGCLKEGDQYTCSMNKRTGLTFKIDGQDITPDDYASGAVVFMEEGDSVNNTVIEMSLMKNNISYLIFVQTDTIAFEGTDLLRDSIKSAYISIDGNKYNINMDKLHFTELSGSTPSNYTNLFYYEIARGSFSGKFLKDGQVDSSDITGTFCYDDAPEKK